MGYSFYYPPENKIFVARNTEFLENSLITQEASGSIEDLEIIKEEDTHLSVNTSLYHDEDDQEIDEPQSDINLIRRKIWCIRASTHQRPQRNKAQYVVSKEDQYAVLEIWNEYNILEDSKRGPNSKKSPIRREDENAEDVQMADHMRPMEELLRIPILGIKNAIIVPAVLANEFELKTKLLDFISNNSFFGLENDDPHSHIKRFYQITRTFKVNQVPHDVVKLILFPFSLKGAAKTWLEN
ncbi:hypothetical protein Tco_1283455 [Tanacetum coccineum]